MNSAVDNDLQMLLAPYRDTIESFGWELHVIPDSARVYRRFKNGKMRKTPDAQFEFCEFQHDHMDIDENGQLIEIERPSLRPWYVTSTHTARASTFASSDHAIERFLELGQSEAATVGLLTPGSHSRLAR